MLNFVALWIPQWKLYFHGTSFLITVIKKDIILVSRTLDPSFIHFYRENINQTVTCRITHAAKAYYDKLIPGPGGYSNLSWLYGCPAQSFNHHSITKPEKTKICNLCLNQLFLDHVERPFLKTNQYFLPCKLGCIGTFWQPKGKPEEKFIEN